MVWFHRALLGWAALLLVAIGLAGPAGAVTVERVTSPGGIEAWLVEDHGNPVIDLDVSLQGGASVDPAGKAGLAALVAGLLDEGAGSLDSQAFQSRLEDLAIHMGFQAGKDHFYGHMKTLTENSAAAFDLFGQALAHPRFDREPLERVRGQLLSTVAQEQQNPETLAALQWFKTHFADQPYAQPIVGTAASLRGLTLADLKDYAAAHLARDTLLVAVAGDITPDRLAPLLDRAFGDLPAHAAAVAVPEAEMRGVGEVQVIPRDNPQSIALFGARGVKRDDPDWYAAYVMNHILGGGAFSSWLVQEVREKRGLAYSVYTTLEPLDHAGLILGEVATRNAEMGQSLAVIKAQWARMRDQGPTEAELADAKTYLTGSFPLQQDSTAHIARLVLSMRQEKLGLDYLDRRNALIEAVTLDDVRRVAKRLLDPDALSMVIVGQPDGVTPQGAR
jgi:zinc protease